ncbi:hypothetical protein J2X76_003628 [Neorhizobium sp. 2083]|uniref:hypothetical protein n=1 Tax=Neorhizobium sp. 2083 TaxID=2817762 RepID=UPI0028674A98|nr:hypothetical protein [Neorhizobium sp. 2083]MDR6818451.1 hypothetical protein [Neorhizobium sp. 2083]
MKALAHTLIMRSHASGNPIATTDRDAEFYLINHGYAAYSQKPLMVLTKAGTDYADRELAWQRQEERWAR